MSRRIVDFSSNVDKYYKNPWSPANLSTELWVDASDASTITESGGSVSQWNDKSGNGNHATQENGANQLTTGVRTLGGLNTMDISPDKYMAFSTIDMVGKEVWAVFQVDDMTNDFFVLGDGGNIQFSVNTGSQSMRLWPRYSGGARSETIYQDTPYFNGWRALTNKTFSVNGTNDVTANTYVSGTLTVSRLCRSRYDHSWFSDGMLGEVVIVNELTDTARQTMEGYLAWKWGLEGELPVAHPYKSAAPLV